MEDALLISSFDPSHNIKDIFLISFDPYFHPFSDGDHIELLDFLWLICKIIIFKICEYEIFEFLPIKFNFFAERANILDMVDFSFDDLFE